MNDYYCMCLERTKDYFMMHSLYNESMHSLIRHYNVNVLMHIHNAYYRL